ncbi:MAG TPA: hypothetical protein VGN42_10080 [Pirellulales bacterium]|jgi:hypothetical protein|nr:hypothetical protein [Pirellulales bacterium]
MNELAMPPPEGEPRLGYEPRDVRVGWILTFAGVLAAMVILVLPLADWTFRSFARSAAKTDVPASPLAGDQSPPRSQPLLQSRPSEDLAELRQREDEALSHYRWIDKEQGAVQIPVDRAIELLIERGLPEPPPTKQDGAARSEDEP